MHQLSASRVRVRPVALIAVLALVVALVPIAPVAAAPVGAQVVPEGITIHVDNSVDGPGSGTEADPFQLLGDALAVAESGDTVMVAAGIYGPESGETLPFVVPSDVAVIGEYSDEEGWLTALVGWDWYAEPTAQEAPISPVMVLGDALTPVDVGTRQIEGEGVEGVLIQDLLFGYNTVYDGGAGIAAFGSQAAVENCAFIGLTAHLGSAILAIESDLSVSRSLFVANGGGGGGPILSLDDAALARIDREALRLDKLPADPGSVKAQIDATAGYGGAVLGMGSDLAFTKTVFLGNSAYWAGGAVLNDRGTLWTDDSVFAVNSVGGDDRDDLDLRGADVQDYAAKLNDIYMEPYGGGAVNNLGGTYGAKRTWYVSNYGDPGAAVMSQAGSTKLDQCMIAANQGAAVVTVGASALLNPEAETSEYRFARLLPEDPEDYPSGTDIDRCLFDSNDGFHTTYLESHPSRVTNSLFVNNWAVAITAIGAEALAGSLAILPSPDEDITVESSIEGCTYADNYVDFATVVGPKYGGYTPVVNTILWGNDAWEPFAEAVNIDAFNVCHEDGLDGGEVVDSFSDDPMLNEDYTLAEGSPCIDAGTASPEYPVKVAELALAWDLRPWDFRNLGRPLDGDGDGEALYDIGAFEYLTSGRVAGPTRIETAVKVSQQHFGQSDVVVIATGRVFADGLAGSGLAGMYRSPILLTAPDLLPSVVADEIVRLGATKAVILGGPVAVEPAVEASLADLGLEIERIGGVDRYETAAMIAERLMTERRMMFLIMEEPEIPEEPEVWPLAFIARGDLFADALAVSPVAYANQLPVLLVRPDELPEHTVDVLVELGLSRAVVLGGDVAVNSLVAAEVGALAEDVVRIDGADRYETSANIAEWAYDNYLATFEVTGIATGEDFADALSGGAGIGSMHGVLLLNPQASVHEACEAAIENHAEEIQALTALGGPAAVSESVYEYLMGLLAP